MLSLRGRAAAGLTIFALGFGVAACGDRENVTQGNQGDTPDDTSGTTRQPETSSVGNEPVAPTTSSSSSDSSGSGGSAYP